MPVRRLIVASLLLLTVAVSGCAAATETPKPVQETTTTKVPDVAGLSRAAAQAAIEGAGYKMGAVATQTVESGTEGSVVGQDPAAGAEVTPGTAVNITVAAPSAGATVRVPDAVGFTIVQVRMLLGNFGLVAEIKDFKGDDPQNVKIKRQKPEAGAEVAPGSVVELWTK